jgi:hypothetical protein
VLPPDPPCLLIKKVLPARLPPMGEGEIKPEVAAGVGARRYATMKDVLRASASVGDDGVLRRLRPADRTWSGSQSTLMMVAGTLQSLQ